MTMLEKLRTALILLLLPPIVGVEWPAVGAEVSLCRSPQDSLQRAIEEHHWAYQNLIAPHYEAPSLLALQYATSLSSVETLFSSRRGAGISPLAEGASRSQFQINCTSLFHLDSLSSVWGRATYISASSQNVQGRETAHYPLTAPLLIRSEGSSMVSVTPSAEAIVMPFPLAGGGVLREAMKPIKRVEIGILGS